MLPREVPFGLGQLSATMTCKFNFRKESEGLKFDSGLTTIVFNSSLIEFLSVVNYHFRLTYKLKANKDGSPDRGHPIMLLHDLLEQCFEFIAMDGAIGECL